MHMKNFKHLLVFSTICSFILITSCNKDYCKKDNERSQKGLELSPSQEVPPAASKAFGTMDVFYDKKTRMLKYAIRWTNLTGNPIGSHIHGTAKRGVNAPIKHDFTSLIPKTVSGTFT